MNNFAFLVPALVALLTSSYSLAQNVLFEDDFSNGMGQWAAEFPWHVAPANDFCTSMSSPPPSYGPMARLGGADCTFNAVCSGTSCAGQKRFEALDSFTIPADAVNPRLTFDSYVDTEACNPLDCHSVYFYVNGSNSRTSIATDNQIGPWHSVSVDLSPWIGQEVRLGFLLFNWDHHLNDGLGWLIDNVRITEDCASQSYCVAAANSASPTGAIIGYTGSLEIAQNNLALTLQDGPPGQFALFFYGPFQAQVPVAQGHLCIGPDQFGFRRLLPAGQIDPNGNLSYPIDFTALTGSHTLLPGIAVNFQCWYRDVINGASTTNFSNAQSIKFCP
ncbi:MAG: hypothetical protein JKY61_05045 [Planctomycetes bacterium]|nr:hypothetical protein [Planctomycetota bacterium]